MRNISFASLLQRAMTNSSPGFVHKSLLFKTVGGSLSGAIPDGKIPRDAFVCVLADSLCNM